MSSSWGEEGRGEGEEEEEDSVFISYESSTNSSTQREQGELSPMGQWPANLFRDFSQEKEESEKLFS